MALLAPQLLAGLIGMMVGQFPGPGPVLPPPIPPGEPCFGAIGPTAFGECDDGNACTLDTCVNGICQHCPRDGFSCPDSDPCTYNETCVGTVCTKSERDCDDGDPCTRDWCIDNIKTDCIHAPDTGPVCDDGVSCTENDACDEGECVGTWLDCDDGNSCTNDYCIDGACVNLPDSFGTCSDGDSVRPTSVSTACASIHRPSAVMGMHVRMTRVRARANTNGLIVSTGTPAPQTRAIPTPGACSRPKAAMTATLVPSIGAIRTPGTVNTYRQVPKT